jgi:PiT family inorganic phosphate transporter
MLRQHRAAGAIVGIGMHRHEVRWKLVREFLLAWVVTVPAGAVLAAVAYRLLVG